MSETTLVFNGINARTGDYLLSMEAAEAAELALKATVDPSLSSVLQQRDRQANKGHLGAIAGVDLSKLEEAGWGVVFPVAQPGSAEARAQEAILDRLKPLLERRRDQASKVQPRRFQRYAGSEGVQPQESWLDFLVRNGAGPGTADPDQVPYYLLIVADPELIPFEFQFGLSVQRGVGRLYFDDLEAYARYAESVVEAERQGPTLPRRAAFFAPENPNDPATLLSSRVLVDGLLETLSAEARLKDWTLDPHLRGDATRSRLEGLLSGSDAPALLFTASHGIGYPIDDALQRARQGALLCQDWPGPGTGAALREDHYFCAEHLRSDANLLGTIALSFACYGAGTPAFDEVASLKRGSPVALTSRPFVAKLPQALLSLPKGGALAFVSHVDRAFDCSFRWPGTGPGGVTGRQIAAFRSVLYELMHDGRPIGAAMDCFDVNYATLATLLAARAKRAAAGLSSDPIETAHLWTACNDARNYSIIGDPAVRLACAAPGETGARKPLARSTAQGAPPDLSSPPSAQTPRASAESDAGPRDISFASADREPAADGAGPGATTHGPLKAFIQKLGETLARAATDAASLQVSTWVTDDLSRATIQGDKVIGAELRALTQLALDGDTVVLVPERGGEVDRTVWEIHSSMVRQAQETRAELMKTLVSAAAALPHLMR